jgi:hypothetical protein
MKKLLFTTGLLFITLVMVSQNGIFRTYEDYKNNNLEDVGLFDYNTMSGASGTIVWKENGKKKKLKCKDFWGFMYQGFLFRNNHDYGGLAYIVVSKGNYVYYECGHIYFSVIQSQNKIESKYYHSRDIGYYHTISKDLNSKFYSLAKAPGQFKKLVKKNPSFKSLQTCLGKAPLQKELRICLKEDIHETKNFIPWDSLVKFSVPGRFN